MWKIPPAEIVAAVDFSEASAHAIRIAGAVAERFDAHLVALHAETLEAPLYFTHEQVEALERQRVAARAQAQQYLAAFVRQLTAHEFDAVVADGTPVEVLLRRAATADLIVLGTHGRRGPTRWWLGSVAERVARAAAVPVLVAHPTSTPETAAAMCARAFVALPSGAVGEAARQYARALTDAFRGELIEEITNHPAQAATSNQATLLVTPVSFQAFGDMSELVRSTNLPTLFVPEAPGLQAATLRGIVAAG